MFRQLRDWLGPLLKLNPKILPSPPSYSERWTIINRNSLSPDTSMSSQAIMWDKSLVGSMNAVGGFGWDLVVQQPRAFKWQLICIVRARAECGTAAWMDFWKTLNHSACRTSFNKNNKHQQQLWAGCYHCHAHRHRRSCWLHSRFLFQSTHASQRVGCVMRKRATYVISVNSGHRSCRGQVLRGWLRSSSLEFYWSLRQSCVGRGCKCHLPSVNFNTLDSTRQTGKFWLPTQQLAIEKGRRLNTLCRAC